MTMSSNPSAPAGIDDQILVDLVDEIAKKVQAGVAVDVGAYLAAHPQHADRLRQLLPAVELLAELGHSASAGEASVPPGGSGFDLEQGRLGDFRILREVGRGGMGVVYEAEQISLGRRVALKVLPFAAALDPKQLQRFKNEAQAAAHLQHPHIVPVHSVGCERGVHFYAMQFIDGHTLAAVIHELRRLTRPQVIDQADSAGAASGLAENFASGRWEPNSRVDPQATGDYAPVSPLRECSPTEVTMPVAALSTERSTASAAFFRTVANLGVQAAEALEHAHQFGIIHRDIKPANLLVEWRAGGVNPPVLWITDFGLAHCQSQPGLTMTGDLVGTLRYMSPEQALAKRVAVDARTDVYSLGATLYELLTLEPAYNGRNREEVLRQIAFEEPRLPRRLRKVVPAELETVVLKAMAKSPEERYGSAQELADDLKRFLEDKPIKARRPSLRQRALKWSRRHKAVVRAAMVVWVLAVAALAVVALVVWRTNQELGQKNQEMRQTAYYQSIALADRELSVNNLNRAEESLDLCPPDLRGWEWHYLRRLGRGKGRAPLRHDAAVLSVALSPDSERIASADQHGFLKIWDLPSGQLLHSIHAYPGGQARSVAFSPDGQRLASACWDGTVTVWEAQSGRSLHSWKAHAGAHRVAFSPDGRCLVSAGRDERRNGEARIWEATTYKEILAIAGLKKRGVRGLALSPDGQRLAISFVDDPEVKVWDAQSGRELLTFRGHTRGVNCVAFSLDGRWIASGSGAFSQQGNGEGKIWDSKSGREWLTLSGHMVGVWSVTFSPDGRRLATGGMDQNVKIWDLTTGQEALTLHEHRNEVWSVAFSRDGHYLVSASRDRTVRVWDGRPWQDGEPGQEWLTLHGHASSVTSVAFHPTEQRLASGDPDGVIKLWDLSPWRAGGVNPLSRTLRTHRVWALAFSPDGKWLATASPKDDHVKLWDVASTQEIRSLKGRTQQFLCVAFSPNGEQLAAAGFQDWTVDIWNVATGQLLQSLPGHNWAILSVAFCPPDGRYLATGGVDGTLRIWDRTTGQEIGQPQPPPQDSVRGVAFSRDGRFLVSGSYDRTVPVWEKREGGASWKPVHILSDPTGGVTCVAFSPDGRRLAWGGTDSTVKVADLEASRVKGVSPPIVTLHGHTSWVQGIAFSPDGRHLASASRDGTVKIWETPATLPGRVTAAPDR
jgi:WD40 repeat protein/serine/threonine protein kinase